MKNSQMRDHNKRMHKGITAANSLPIALLALLFAVTACTSIDCPMNNRVYTVYQITRNNPTAIITSVMALISPIIGLVNEFIQRKKKRRDEEAVPAGDADEE